jgi:hypothetical protein
MTDAMIAEPKISPLEAEKLASRRIKPRKKKYVECKGIAMKLYCSRFTPKFLSVQLVYPFFVSTVTTKRLDRFARFTTVFSLFCQGAPC